MRTQPTKMIADIVSAALTNSPDMFAKVELNEVLLGVRRVVVDLFHENRSPEATNAVKAIANKVANLLRSRNYSVSAPENFNVDEGYVSFRCSLMPAPQQAATTFTAQTPEQLPSQQAGDERSETNMPPVKWA